MGRSDQLRHRIRERPVQLPPVPRVQPPFDRLLGAARVHGLLSRDGTGLRLKQPEPCQIMWFVHRPSLYLPDDIPSPAQARPKPHRGPKHPS
jgi:hypothetical protein